MLVKENFEVEFLRLYGSKRTEFERQIRQFRGFCVKFGLALSQPSRSRFQNIVRNRLQSKK